MQREITIKFQPLWKDLHPIISQLILKPMVRAIFIYLFGVHVVKCKTLCCLLMLQIFISFHEPLVLPLLSCLFKRRGKRTLSHRNSTERCLSVSRKGKICDEVTESLNSDPKFQIAIKMPIQFYLKEFTNYCWKSYLGGKNIVSFFLKWEGRWEIEKICNNGIQQCWG